MHRESPPSTKHQSKSQSFCCRLSEAEGLRRSVGRIQESVGGRSNSRPRGSSDSSDRSHSQSCPENWHQQPVVLCLLIIAVSHLDFFVSFVVSSAASIFSPTSADAELEPSLL